MKRALSLNGRQHTIEILSTQPACRFEFDGAPALDAAVENPEPAVYSILLEGRTCDVFVEDMPAGIVVWVDGYRVDATIHDPRRRSRDSTGAGGEGVQTITSPMPGKVVRVLVAPGDSVEPGQGIIVVEAMKMQNEMKANRAGKVLTIPVQEGATVTAGEVLATIG
jgi:biotin carboxyl carrier protein